MQVTAPFPVFDLSSDVAVVVMACAGRSHVGDFASHERPRPYFSAKQLAWASDPERVCPYCGSAEPLGGEEHVLSVTLGNWFWVIPPNVVCGRCNNGVLSMLDTKLQQHPFIQLLRTLNKIPGRSGQPPAMGASNLSMRRDEAGALHIETNHPRHVKQDAETVTSTAKWVNFGPPQRRLTARGLLKVGLGILWLARGPAETMRSHYDHVRDAIHETGFVPLRFGFDNSSLPSHALQIQAIRMEGQEGFRVNLDYSGTQLWAETAGYPDQASPEFLALEIDVEFAGLTVDNA